MRDTQASSAADQTLLALLGRLDAEGYDFVTPTPATHARVLARPDRATGRTLRDILGWSLPFAAGDAPAWLVDMLQAADLLQGHGERLKSAIRVSRLHGDLFVHSAYPTDQRDSVFLGPDSYRFADFIARELTGHERGTILDIGGGAAVGAIVAARTAPGARVIASDINPRALRFARINAAHAGVTLDTLKADGLEGAPDGLEVALANPPYMADSDQTNHTVGGSLSSRVRAGGFKYSAIAENVGSGQRNYAAAMDAWVRSPGHRSNLLRPNLTSIGFAGSREGGRNYWAQVFGAAPRGFLSAL